MKFESQSHYDDWFDKAFKKICKGREDHEFNHFNSSLGCYIYSKEHYKSEMKKKRMIPYDVMEEVAENFDKENPRKEYGELTPKAMDVVRSLRLMADKNGNLKLGQRAVDALVEIGAISSSDHIPDSTPLKGGFNV